MLPMFSTQFRPVNSSGITAIIMTVVYRKLYIMQEAEVFMHINLFGFFNSPGSWFHG